MPKFLTFNGKDPHQFTIDAFIAEFKTSCITERIPQDKCLDLFNSLIRRPTDTNYLVALGDATQIIWPDALVADAAENLVEHDHQTCLQRRINWLKNQYEGPVYQQAVLNSLRLLKQKGRTPESFYQKVVQAVNATGFPEDGRGVLIQNTFLDGLSPPVN